MCGRYVFDNTENLEKRFGVKVTKKLHANFNAAPTQFMPIVREGSRGPVLDEMKWGLIPPFSKDGKTTYATFNARSEGVFESRLYRGPIKRSRCLVPATGFYEWKRDGSTKKQPYYIRVKGDQLFSFAGIWETWKDKEEHEHHSYSILTTTPNKEMSALHDRMPVIIHPEDEAAWLSDEHDEDFIKGFLRPYEDDGLIMHEVSKDVNTYKNNNGKLIKPVNSK